MLYAPAFFGMRAMKEAPNPYDNHALEWNSFIKAVTSSLSIPQKWWKKAMGKLSGPEALSPAMLNTAVQISSPSKSLSSQAAFSNYFI